MKPNLYQRLQYRFQRRTIQAGAVNDIWGVDLIDMNSEKLSKSGYIINAIDIHSRYAQSVRLHTKNKNDVAEAFNELFDLFGAKPKRVFSDMEGAIVGLSDWLKSQSIELYHVQNSYNGPDTHSVSIVERFNRTMRERMMEYKTELKNRNWNQLITYTINNFIPEYNARVHSTIGTTPEDAYRGDIDVKHMHEEREAKIKKAPKQHLKVGDIVYLQKPKEIIRGKKETKYYDTPEEIAGVKDTNPTTYTLKGHGETGYYRQQFILPKEK